MFLSNFGLTLNLQAQYPTVELIYVSDDFAFLESMPFFGRRGGLPLGGFMGYGCMFRKCPALHSHSVQLYVVRLKAVLYGIV